MRLFANANYDFIARRRVGYMISGAFLAVALVAALVGQFTRGSWLNYGVDFTGGTIVQVEFEQATTVADLRGVVDPIAPGSEITRFGGENEFLVRAPGFSEDGANVGEQLTAAFEASFGEGQFNVVRTEAVGPKIGSELQTKAALAILISFLATLAYLAFRFEWRFGVAAVVATMHDIAITLGLLAIFGLEVSLPTVAAVLTIVGYSLNDTIVVFDRARENLKKIGRRAELGEVLNRSINETIPRTVLTSATTLVTLFSLFVLGGETIREFALILFFGVLVGTYSSIFIAAPTLLAITQRWKPNPATKSKSRPAKAGAVV